MNAITIKTRHGLILQGAIAEAMRRVGIAFNENCQYDADCERPDFLSPDASEPKFTIEVHQTDARNSFQMKILRSFTAVTEAKAFFGESLVSVSVLFGDPDVEVPASNMRALFGFFDVNIVPRKDASNPRIVKKLEASALTLASTDGLSVADATAQLVLAESAGIDALSALLTNSLRSGRVNPTLVPLWQLEQKRLSTLGTPPGAGARTYYKRGILQSLFLSDAHFAELQAKRDPNKCPKKLREQLVLTGLAEGLTTTKGYVVTLNPTIRDFINAPKSAELRSLCEKRLDAEEGMHWFFEDIRDVDRRKRMVEIFFEKLRKGSGGLAEAIADNLSSDNYEGIPHRRCWMADLTALYLGISHNEMNRQFTARRMDPQQLGNPFNQISYKSSRFMSDAATHKTYVEGIKSVVDDCLASGTAKTAADEDELSGRFLGLRLDGAIKLHKLNPLNLVIESIATDLGLIAEYQSTHSILSDLSGSSNPVNKFYLYHLSDGRQTVLLNAVAVHDSHGDDKSKEWGARRLSTLYRLVGDAVSRALNQKGIFVIDGEWEQRDVNRLYRSGWDYVIRLSELEPLLRIIFRK